MAARSSASVRAGSGVTVVAAILALSVPTATASPVFTDLDTRLTGGGSASTEGANCTETLNAPGVPSVPVVENGPVASFTETSSATFANTGNASDNGTGVATATVAAHVTSANGSMRTVEVSGHGTAHFADSLPTSACGRLVEASAELDATFAIAQAGIVTLRANGDGSMTGFVEIRTEGTSLNKSVFVDAAGLPTDGVTRAFVQPGTYVGSVGVRMSAGGGTTSTPDATGAVSLEMTFAAAGSQSAAPTGKASKYLTLPSSRSCASQNLLPTVTTKKKRAATIKQIAFFLGEQRVARVKHPKHGAAIAVPLPQTQDADVRVEVTLLPKHHGQKPKVVKESASYVACAV